ncbi:autoinducer binding domain-containing protein [Mixta intestinalis]|uniref:Transcriptional activator protein EsaR n=1 Tax=Mixta intestinalis TaxID=1615494 RepID=A0A6P1PZL5_9GAMM|nr:autoinducer binding domain-containing protein [Mixta intestinalis]QHM71307.1 Transcriptional activator protein EsaR [Mixta intestinalis]
MKQKIYIFNAEINEKIASLIESQLSEFGDVIYSYGVVNKNNPVDCIIVNNCSDWFDDDYRKNNRQLTDPVVLKALAGSTDFSWDKNALVNFFGSADDVFNDAETFNITTGHTVSFTDANDNLAMLTLIMKTGTREEFFSTINAYKSQLNELLKIVHVKNMALRGVNNSIVPPVAAERAQVYADGETVSVLPLAPDDIVVSERLFVELLERARNGNILDKNR